MRTKLTRILDDCLGQVEKGESIEACLAEYPDMREELEPLLRIALSISSIPKVKPSPEFVTLSRFHLINRINQESDRTKAIKSGERVLMLSGIAVAFHSAWQNTIKAKKVAIPVTVILLLMLSAGLYQFGGFNFLSPTPAIAAPATLTILNGSVEIQNPESDASQEGYDGMVLSVGTGIRTGPDSHALITFFEGSTAKLEPNTYLEIRQLEEGDEQSTTIILKQWLGRTWSRVIKMVDSRSRYEIETPSATAIVRGTLFTTEVTETGFTTVSTTEGLVSVAAQEQEVYVPANQKTEVEKGTEPSQPVTLAGPKSEIIVTIYRPAVGSVSDPTGSSTGILPTGLAFNQIQGSYSSSPSEGTQIITIAEPITGKYFITLRYLDEGNARYRIQGKSYGKINFDYVGSLDTKKESGYIIHLDLQVDDGEITGNLISKIEVLGDKMPEKIVNGKLYKKDSPPGKDKIDDVKDDDKKDSPPGKDKTDDVKDVDKKDRPPGKDKTDDVKDVDKKDSPPGKDRINDVKDDDGKKKDDDGKKKDGDGKKKDGDGKKKDGDGKKKDDDGKKKDDDKKDDDKKDRPPGKDKKNGKSTGNYRNNAIT